MKLAILLSLSLLAASCTEQAPTAGTWMTMEQLLTRHTDARGGEEAIENIRVLDLQVEITEPEFTITGTYRATRDGWLRIDIFSDGARVFTEALGPDGGWQMFDDGTVADLSLDGEDALKRGLISNLYGLHEITAQGYTLALIGSTSYNGSTYWEVKKSSPDGFSEHLYLDKDTFMITSDIETSALHPDLDSSKTRQETFRSDYREVAGVLFSHKSEKYNLDTGDIMQTAIVTSREVNIDLDPAQFLRPESTPADD